MARLIDINYNPLRRAQSTQFQASASHRLATQIGMSSQYANVQKSSLQLNKDRLNMEWDAYQREKEQNQIIGYVTGAAQVVGGAAITAFGGGAAGIPMMINGGLTIGGTAAAAEMGDGVQKYFQMGQNLVNLGSQVYGAYSGYVNQKKELQLQQNVSDYKGYMAQATAAAMTGDTTANPYKEVELKDIYGNPILDSNGNAVKGPQGFSNFEITTRDGKKMKLGEFARFAIADASDIPLVPGFMEGNQTQGKQNILQKWTDAVSLRDTRAAARFISADAEAMQKFQQASMEGEQDLFNMRLQEATSQEEIHEIIESNGMLSPKQKTAMEQSAVARLNRKLGIQNVRRTTDNLGLQAGLKEAREAAGNDPEALRDGRAAAYENYAQKKEELKGLVKVAYDQTYTATKRVGDALNEALKQVIKEGGKDINAIKETIPLAEGFAAADKRKQFDAWDPENPRHTLADINQKLAETENGFDFTISSARKLPDGSPAERL